MNSLIKSTIYEDFKHTSAQMDGEKFSTSSMQLSSNVDNDHAQKDSEECSKSSALLSTGDSGHETVSVDAVSKERVYAGITNDAKGSPVKEFVAASWLTHKSPSYTTSTPKKDSFLDLRILPSKIILDDPLVSSIDDSSESGDDDERTSNQVESLNSDDEGTISQLQVTKLPANFSNNNVEDITLTNKNYILNSLSDYSKETSKQASMIMDRFMKDVSIESKSKKNHSITGEISNSNPESVKRKIFDIPVSPKLKCRVRERLYTLVNSIEGHKEKIDLEETTNDKIYNRGLSSTLNHQTLNQDILKANPVRMAVNTTHENSFNRNKRMVEDKSFSSDMSSIISERYGNVMAQMLESQLKTLHIQQEQLYSDRISLALQKKEQEIQKRIAIYRDKLQETLETMEKSEHRCSQSEKQLVSEREKHQEELKILEEKYLQKFKLINQEWETKVRNSETKAMTIQEEVTKSCNNQVNAVIRGTQEKILSIERNCQKQVQDLNAVIYKLRDEIKFLEGSTENSDLKVTNSNLLRENSDLKIEINRNQKKMLNFDETENKIKELEQEVDTYKFEKDQLQKELNSCQTDCYKLQHNMRIHNNQPNNSLLTDCLAENKRLNEYIVKMQSEFPKAMEKVQNYESLNKKVSQLATSLEKEQKKAINMQHKHAQEIVALTKHQELTMLSIRIAMENERSKAVSDALAHSRIEISVVTKELEKTYNGRLENIQSHASAQIEEYKKAVKILKCRLKKMGAKLPPNG